MTQPIFRADRFRVPSAAAAQFLDRIRRTHRVLDDAEGCLLNLVLTRDAGPVVEVLTVVHWRDRASHDAARVMMRAAYAAEGFSPDRFMQELGVEAEPGDFTRVPLGPEG